ncbi:MAG: hypothetical protein EOM52_04480 [Clostridia bacterium]|nr:hypothetical protein [Clostridia bacterium]
MTMRATILEVGSGVLLVCDHRTGQEVVCFSPCAACFRAGERICIHFSGVMTASLPPQITATCIRRLGCR